MRKIIFIFFILIAFTAPIAFADSIPAVTTGGATSINSGYATLNATITPGGPTTNAWFEYGTTSAFGQTTASQAVGSGYNALNFSLTVSNLQANTVYYFRAAAQNQYGTVYGATSAFTSAGQSGTAAPSVLSQSASNATAGSASLTGIVQPNGSPTSAWFDYGPNSSLGQQTSIQSIGNTASPVNVYANLTGLQPNTTYYFRVVAQNAYGTTYGPAATFFTSISGSATGLPSVLSFTISASVGTVTASVDPRGQSVDAWAEYGTTQYLGQSTAVQTFQNTYNTTAQFTFNLAGLVPGTAYYYRVAARNAYGTVYGNTATFTAVSQYQPPPAAPSANYGVNFPAVTTKTATETDETSARLNSSVNPNGSETTAWFEFGRDLTLRGSGGERSLGSAAADNQFAVILVGLKPGTTYYYRAAAKNNFGMRYGAIMSVRTTGTAVAAGTTTPLSGTTETSGNNTVSQADSASVNKNGVDSIFSLQTDNDTPTAGGEIGIAAAYRNPLNSEIRDIKITVTLPQDAEYVSSSPQPSSRNGNVYIFDLGNAPAGAAGQTEIRVKIKRNAGKTLNFSASLQYRDLQGASYAVATDRQVELIQVKSTMDYKALSASISNVIGSAPSYVWFFAILIVVALGAAAAANAPKK